MTTSTIKPTGGDEVPPAGVVGNVADVGVAASLTKRDSEEDTWASKGYNYINPFVHRIEIDSHIEVAKVSPPSSHFIPFSSYPTPLFHPLPASHLALSFMLIGHMCVRSPGAHPKGGL